jgi:cytochrome c oxidase cbb3-type subunit III
VEKEKDIMLDHSYDGIVELDNFMPPWLKYMFYGTILFAVVYVFNYSVLGLGKTQIQEYEEELRIAAVRAEERMAMAEAEIDENTVQFDASGPSINAGQSIYDANCAACHAKDGGGGVGPNLTDDYWIHGGSISDIFRVVKYGVIEKGMVPWEDQLSPLEMQHVSSYVMTLVGTTPANPKEAQGELYEPAIEEPLDAITEDELEVIPAE